MGVAQVPLALLSIQVPANTLGKSGEDGPSPCAPAPICEAQKRLLVPGFSLARPWPLQIFGSEPSDGRTLCVSFSLQLKLSNK